MKKKILVMTFAFLMLTLTIMPFILTVQAEKTVIPFSSYREYSGSPSTAYTGDQKTSQDEDEHLVIRWGAIRDISYSNVAAGISGTMHMETVRSITNYETPYVIPGAVEGIAKGHGIYKITLTITGGSHGTGTLEGFAMMSYEWNFLVDPAVHVQTGNYTLMKGTGDFEGAQLHYDSWNVKLPSGKYGSWTVGELVLP